MENLPATLAVILLLVWFCLPPAMAGDGSFESYLIAKSESRKYDQIACDGGTVAWVEYGSGNSDEPGYYPRSIYKYDVATGRKELVLADTSWKRDLDLSGKMYAWSDGRGIFVYDEARNLLTFLYSSCDQYSPSIDGDVVVWVEHAGQEFSLAEYDLESGVYRKVASSPEYLGNPAVSGNLVVFCERRGGRDGIVCLNLATSEEKVLCLEEGPRTMPAIDGRFAVWSDGRDGPYQVYLCDLETGQSGPVNSSPSVQMYPDISDSRVVWEDYGNSSGNPAVFDEKHGKIRLYDWETGRTDVVVEGQFPLEFPRISEGFVVWADGRNGAHDIFLRKISGEAGSRPQGDTGRYGSAAPTSSPTPDTKVRYYSMVSGGAIEWYSLVLQENAERVSFELRWEDPTATLSLAVVSPGGSSWRFSDTTDSRSDQAVRMTISGSAGNPLEPGVWVVAVSGATGEEPVPYDLCWY